MCLLLIKYYIFLILFITISVCFLKVNKFTFDNFKKIILFLIIIIIFNIITGVVCNLDILQSSCTTYCKKLICIIDKPHLLDLLNNYILHMDSNNSLDQIMDLSGSTTNFNSNPNPNPTPNNTIVLTSTDDDDDDDDKPYFVVDHMSRLNLPYDLDGLILSQGLGYDIDYMIGENINYLVNKTPVTLTDVIGLDYSLKKDISSLHLLSKTEGESNSHIGNTGIKDYHVSIDNNTFVLDNFHKDKPYYEFEYKDIFKKENFVRISNEQVYPILDYMKKFEVNNFNRTIFSNNLDLVSFNHELGDYCIASDLRTIEWRVQSSKVKEPGAFEGETTMLYTSILAEIFKLKDGFLIGPENRNIGGVADVVINKHNAPFVHVEYKSLDGAGFCSLLAQAKKYLYMHNLFTVDGMFGIYAKGNLVSFFLINEHGHSDKGYLLKGPMYNGMFGLYVDLEERLIKILPQENTYYPQYLTYDMDTNEGYIRAELIGKFMSLHKTPPAIELNKYSNRFEFVEETDECCPVQIFCKNKDEFVASFVNTKGKFYYKKLDFDTALKFANRPSDILTNDFLAHVFRNK